MDPILPKLLQAPIKNTMETTLSLADHLRDATRPLHTAAEAQPFMGALLGGALPVAAYGDWLRQQAFLAEKLEAWAKTALSSTPELAPLLADNPYHTSRARADLKALGLIEASSPMAETVQSASRLGDSCAVEPLRLAGYFYVVEGSNNGGRFLARRMREVFRGDAPVPTALLDSYGEQQPATWKRFRAGLDTLGGAVGDSGCQAVMHGAMDYFQSVIDISAALGQVWLRSPR